MPPEEKRAYNREASKRYRQKVKDTDEYKQKNLAFVNKYLENNRQKVYEYQKVYKKAWYQKKKEELINLCFPNLE
jgi:NADH:ubiquinone oxidoreductase subunit E